MAKVSEQAELLLALVTLGGGTVRTDGGRLDRALHEFVEALPRQLQELSFSEGSVGFRCLELPSVLQMAFYMMSADHGEHGDHNVFRSLLPRERALEIAYGHGQDLPAFEATARRFTEVVTRG
jgi:hypothetical protein